MSINAIIQGFTEILSQAEPAVVVLILAQLLVLLCSFALMVLMVKYQGKRALDFALLFREVAIIFIIVRSLTFWAFEWTSPEWALASYITMALAAFMVIALLIREHYLNKTPKE